MASIRQEKPTIGDFVVSDPEFGIGRLVEMTTKDAEIEYFRGPAPHPFVSRACDPNTVKKARLDRQTRAYVHDGLRWRVGRIDSVIGDDDDEYAIAFPNLQGAVLTSRDFNVRWAQPVEDPFEALAALGTESTNVYDPRLRLIIGWYRQLAATSGVEGLALSSIELHDHQLTVVRRVSQDPIQRYLLADEVGLGKTIEAGALLWQLLRDQPESRVLILTPEHLRTQWAEELLTKFHTDQFRRAKISILAHAESDSWPNREIDALIIDEAHHLTRSGPYSKAIQDRVRQLALASSHVYLLTATPVRSNEAAFLDLLHFLDPDNYSPDDLNGFRARVALRDEVALIHQTLTPDLDAFDLSLYATQLRELFPDDVILNELLEGSESVDDENRPRLINRVREYLSETYRLHHRLVRTRRTPELGSTFRVRSRHRAVPFTIEIPTSVSDTYQDLLDAFRHHVAELLEAKDERAHQAIEALRSLCQASGALPVALVELSKRESPHPADVLLRTWLTESGTTWLERVGTHQESILQALAETVRDKAIAIDNGKVVLATSYPTVANVVAQRLTKISGTHRVAIHSSDQDRKTNNEEINRWRTQPHCQILVCDPSAEEGVNLQDADWIIHLDLPWNVFRLEQRIGRVDRFSLSTRPPVKSTVCMYGEQDYARAWFVHAADTCSVFDKSVSSLQYVLADLETELLRRLILGGPSVLDTEIEERRSSLNDEHVRITAHESLDSMSAQFTKLNQLLMQTDKDSKTQQALLHWLSGVGARIDHPAPGTFRIDSSRKLQVPSSLHTDLTPWLDKELALTRNAAVTRRIPLVRAGHGFMDSIVKHLVDSDRGVAFLSLRPVPGFDSPRIVFRTDFLIRHDVNPVFRSTATKLGLDRWLDLELQSVIPPATKAIYTDWNGTELSTDLVKKIPIREKGDQHLGAEPELFERLIAGIDWESLCIDQHSASREILKARPFLEQLNRDAIEHLRSSTASQAALLLARQKAATDACPTHGNQFDELLSAIPETLDTSIKVIGCGAFILVDPTKFEVDQ